MFRFDASHAGTTTEKLLSTANVSTLTGTWTSSTGQASDTSPAVVLTPSTGIASVFVGDAAGVLYAYNATTGAQLWSSTAASGDAKPEIYSSPAVFRNAVYYASNSGNLYVLNAATGGLDCSFSTGKPSQSSPVVVADPDGSGPVVYIGTQAGGGEWAIYGAGSTHGQCTEDWFFNGFKVTGGSWSSPAYGTDATGENLVVFGTKDDDDSVYALDAATGALVWRYQTSTLTEQDVGSSPSISAPGVNGIADGAVYIEGKDGVVYGLNLTTGAVLWQYDVSTTPGTCGACVSSPSLVGKTVIVGTGVGEVALNAVTGAVDWTALSSATVASSPAISGAANKQVAIVAGLKDDLYALNVKSGAVLWSESTPNGFYASPAVWNGMVFDIDLKGNLRAYSPS
jgi:outer membrane protein assembly factor BamB